MASISRGFKALGLLVLVLPLWTFSQETAEIMARQSLSQDLCSTLNTAETNTNRSIYQSNGLCSQFCIQQNYAFAIMQYQSCWCSNIAPAESVTEGVEECNQGCPGYPEVEDCGRQPNYYGYMRLLNEPSATEGGSSSAEPTSSSTTEASPSPTVSETESSQTSTTISSSTSSSTTLSVESSSSEEPTPTPSKSMITTDGYTRTIYLTPSVSSVATASGDSQASQDTGSVSSGSSGPSSGTIAGIVVGVIVAVLAIAGLGLFCFFRRRRQRQNNEEQFNEPGSSQRGSSSGMVGTPRNPEMVVTMDGRTWDPETVNEQRRSRLMAVDPRMDPFQRNMFMRNKSHESVNTLHDDHDYSRKVTKPVLRATNPDVAQDD